MIRPLRIMISVTFLLAGCVNPNITTVKDTKITPSYSPPMIKPAPEQPKKDSDAYKVTDSGKTYSLTLKNADIKDVLLLLSRESGIPIVQERNLRGSVKIEAQNKKLGELLFAVLKPLGYTATVENGVIMVGRPQLATRTFHVNYIKDKRNSTSNMNVSGFSAGSVSVTSTGQSDFWGALENSLEMLVFGTSGKGKREGGGYSIGEAEKKADSKGSISQTHSSSKSKSDTVPVVDVEDPLLSSTQISENQLKQLVINEIAGIIQITDYSENLDKIASFLADVEEGSKRQVLIQAHIMEVGLKDSFAMGIDWKYILDKASNLTFAQSLVPATPANVFKISAVGGDFGVLLDAMKEQGNVNMLSSPKISALNNQKAVIKLTTKQVSWVSLKTTQNNAIGGLDTYTTTPQIDEVGIFLDVTPQIGQNNTITMQIHPSVSEIKQMSVSPDEKSNKPIIDIREIDTMVDARAGETVVIAGLISDKLNESKRSVPLLGDIPYLGALFSYNKQERTKTELVILMTPYILNAKSIGEIRAEHEQRMRNMGGTFHLINNLGSMVSEQSSRDWMIGFPTLPATGEEQQRATSPEQKTKRTEQPSTIDIREQSGEKKSEVLILPAPAQSAVTVPAPLQPASSKPVIEKQPATVPQSSLHSSPLVAVNDTLQPVEPVVEHAAPAKSVYRKKKHDLPTLDAITKNSESIRLMLSNLKSEPKIIRESKNRRMIIKLAGVQSAIGTPNLALDTLGFERAKVAKHTDGTWVVLHASGEELPRIESRVDDNGLTLVAAAPLAEEPVAALAPLKKTQKKRQDPRAEPIVAVAPVPAPVLPVSMATLEHPAPIEAAAAVETGKPAQRQQVAVTTTTSSNEQALYRAGVAAYKSGNCNEAIKQLSSFIASYPDSAFAGDAANYRSDCMERK